MSHLSRCCLLLSLLILPRCLWAWSNHAVGSYAALAALPAVAQAPAVPMEPLEAFLGAEREGLASLLDEQENFAREHFRKYPARPDALRFQGSEQDLRLAFLGALRLNPQIRLANAIQPEPGRDQPARPPLNLADVLVFHNLAGWARWRFIALQPGEPVAALAVLASASDEPDFGHDIGLFSDSPGEAGQRYGFGPQPFGDPGYEFSSQAPFHMGFYHESAIIFAGAPYLARSWPEWRAYQFLGLARYAFEHGHPYWGYRFLGWSMHYVQDLTQPYHSTPLPGETTASMLWTALKAMAGFDADKKAAISRVASRHLGVERYQLDWLLESLRAPRGSALLAAYADTRTDGSYPAYSVDYPREVVAAESHAHAAAFDAAIGHWLATIPADAGGGFSAGNAVAPLRHDVQLDEQLLGLIRAFGAHSRNLARSALQQ
ncbi:phospholipase [Pseudomonas citronellolis]|uniref:phospholipase n=1 Tax=Pseudomonas citronellolis TaxID=53408 RepID=UPI0023E46F98|nr:phospholipase [Pseudomonas citronellolis]MDF3932842.1 phospholipase [Pseudomonas citronellolis]